MFLEQMYRSQHGPWIGLTRPSARTAKTFAEIQSGLDVTYAAIGQSANGRPAGYNVDHYRILLGAGRQTYLAARDVLAAWGQIPSQWMEIDQSPQPPRVGGLVVSVTRYSRLWWLNACRVVDVRDVGDHVVEGREHRYEVAYGTLPGHVETGEERFSVIMDADQRVWYEIRAFSRPYFWLARLAYPLSRRLQRRFVSDSLRQVSALVRQRVESADAAAERLTVGSAS